MNIAIIPARGGSKRIPRKNIKPFNGIPIIGYSIKAALESNLFDEVIVSTDDEEIKSIAESLGATVPFFRSKKAADDYATLMDVLVEVLSVYGEKGIHFDYCCCILATAPFVTSKRLIEGYNLLVESQDFEATVPIVQYGYPIQRSLKIEHGTVSMAEPENLNVRSNDLPSRYHDAGQFYWIKSSSCSSENNVFAMKCKPILLSELEVQDIDTEEDWKLAEFKMKVQEKNAD